MASTSINIKLTGSKVDSTSTIVGGDVTSNSIVLHSKSKKKLMSESNVKSNTQSSNYDNEPIKVNISKPDIAKLTAEALNTTASFVEKFDTQDTKDAADIMRKSAKVAESIPVAVAGIKKEAKPAVNSIKNLWNALEEKGWVGIRDRVNISEMRAKK